MEYIKRYLPHVAWEAVVTAGGAFASSGFFSAGTLLRLETAEYIALFTVFATAFLIGNGLLLYHWRENRKLQKQAEIQALRDKITEAYRNSGMRVILRH